MRTSLVFLSIFVLILAGCSGSGSGSVDMPTPIAVYTEAPAIQPAAQVTAKATVKATVASTATPLPSDTPTSEPSATPTDEPSATPTAALTATATSTPTTAPTEIAATATFTPTLPIPTATVTATIAAPVATPEAATDDSDIYAGLPAEILDLMPAADAANGQALSVSNGCIACHSLEKDVRVVGPSWYSVGTTAGERVAGESAGLYLYTSIVDPNAYINEGYISGLMPLTYKDVLSNEQMADVIAYLLSLQGE
jgi:cytochrome c2